MNSANMQIIKKEEFRWSFRKKGKNVMNICTHLLFLGSVGFALMAGTSSLAFANPMDGVVTGGTASIISTPAELQINQSSNSAMIDWKSFDIAAGETTHFYQPNSNAVALNRVVNSTQASSINGNLLANGKIFVINQNGVLLGKTANVNTTGFIASTADITNNAFMNSTGTYDFNIAGNADASVVNKGHISVQDAGLVAFVAPHVSNEGLIEGNLAKVQLGAGDMYGVDLYGDGLISLAVTAPQGTAKRKISADNSGSIITDGGKVYMTAAAASNVVDSVINNTGVIQAQGLVTKNGEVILTGAGAHVTVSGKIDVSGKHGGGKVKIGGDYQGKGTLAHAAVTNVTSGAVINANSTDTGNGGTIVVWGDEATYFQGTALAQGGANAGNGGLVETSSKGDLDIIGSTVNTMSANGLAGTWLLDPVNFTIDGSNVGTINNSMSNVFIQADNAITFSADVNMGYAGVGLTARAGTAGPDIAGLNAGIGDITLNNHYIRTFGGSVNFQSGNSININNSKLYTRGGAVNLTSGHIDINNSSIATGGGNVDITALYTNYTTVEYNDWDEKVWFGFWPVWVHHHDPIYTSHNSDGKISSNSNKINTSGGNIAGGMAFTENSFTWTGNNNDKESLFGSSNNFQTTGNAGTIKLTAKDMTPNNSNCFAAGGNCSVIDPVAKTNLQIKANNQSKTYGDLITFNGTEFALTSGSLAIGDTITSTTITSSGAAATANVAGSTYEIKIKDAVFGTSFGNYNIDYAKGALTVLRKALTVTANSFNKTYGTAYGFSGLEFSQSGLVNSDTVTSTSLASAGAAATAGVNGGIPYDITIDHAVGTGLNNYNITYANGGLTVDTYHLHVKADAQTKIYGEDDPAPLTYHLLDGTTLQFMTDSFSGAQERIAGEDATAYAINRGTLSAGDNYTIDYAGEYLTITPKALTASLIGTVEKEYNGTTDAALVDGNYSLTGIIHSDDVTMSHPTSGTYDTKNVGINKEVTVHGLTLSGAKAGNYSLLSDLSGLVGKITAKALLLSGVIAQNKIYDGNADATLTGGTLGGVISFTTPGTPDFFMPGMHMPDGMGGFIDMPDMFIPGTPDIVTTEQVSLVSGTGTFDNENVGIGKSVTAVGYGLTGDDAGNYSLSQPTGLSADIMARDLIINAQTDTKFYDGNRDSVAVATVEGLTATTGLIAGDILSVGAEKFDSKNAGARTLSVSGFTLNDGNHGLNYNVILHTAAGTIKQALLSLINVYADDKEYNGNTNAVIHETLHGVVGSENVHLIFAQAQFDNKNVGIGKHVTYNSMGITSGEDVGLANYNYSAVFDWVGSSTKFALANITPKALTIAAHGINKIYDGNIADTVELTDNRISGDIFTDSYGAANFIDKNVGKGKTVDVTGIDIDGTDAGNYTFNTTASTTADITARDLDIYAVTDTKEYDGTKASDEIVLTVGLQGMTDSVTGLHQEFVSKDVLGLNGSTLSVLSGYTVNDGNGGLNYNTAAPHTATGTITQRGLTLGNVEAHGKVYDAERDAEITGALYGVISGDHVQYSISGHFDNKNVGVHKEVYLNNVNLTDDDAGNYFTYELDEHLFADITKAPLTITAVEDEKTYDGTTDSDGEPYVYTAEEDGDEPEVLGLQGDDYIQGDEEDDYIDGLRQVFDSKNAGERTLNVVRTGFTILDDEDYEADVTGNYEISYRPADGYIYKKSLHLSGVSAEDKTYDGTRVAQLDTRDAELSGIISIYHEGDGERDGSYTTDDVTFVGGTGEFDSKNVGYDKRVRASGFTLAGIDAENYELCQPSRLRADITPKGLTVTANDDRKIFNGLEYAGHDDDGGNGDGNGVTYDGFVAGEDETVLTGELTYDGDSQDAVQVGKYDIKLSGYDSSHEASYYDDEEERVVKYLEYTNGNHENDNYDGEGFDPNYNYFITYVNGILNINSNSNPTFRTGGLNRPFSSIANNEIELDESFEPIETGHRDIDLGSGRSNADRLANLEPAAGGSPDAEDLADIEPAAGGDTGVGGGTPSGDIACANAFLSDKPCTEQ